MKIENIDGIGKKVYENGTNIIIYEITGESVELQLSDGIELKTPNVDFTGTDIKKYVIIKDNKLPENREGKLYSVDFAYGEIDIDRLNTDSNYCELMMKKVFSRKGLDGPVKSHCGMLPIDVKTVNNPDGSVKYIYLYLDEMSKNILDKVLNYAHRERIKSEEKSEDNVIELPDNPFERFRMIQSGRVGKKENTKKMSFIQAWKEVGKEEKREKEAKKEKKKKTSFIQAWKEVGEEKKNKTVKRKVEAPIEYAEDVDLESLDNDMAAVFFKTGIVITEKEVDGEVQTAVYPRYSMIFWDKEKREMSDIITAIFSEVDDEKLSEKGEYRKKFVNKVFLGLLTNLEAMRKTYSGYYKCSLAIYR